MALEQTARNEPPWLWGFSMELLSHVHTLRLFVFPLSSHVQPDLDCVGLQTTLVSAPPALSCTWPATQDATSFRRVLRLPLPLLPFDYSTSPPRHCSYPNCIQLSIPLLPLPPSQLHALLSLSIPHDPDFSKDGLEAIHSGDDTLVPREHPVDADSEIVDSHNSNVVEQDGIRSHDDTRCHDHVDLHAKHAYPYTGINGNESTHQGFQDKAQFPPQHGEECRLVTSSHQHHGNDGAQPQLESSESTLPYPPNVQEGHSPHTRCFPHLYHNQNTNCQLNGEALALAQPDSLNVRDKPQLQQSMPPSHATGTKSLQSPQEVANLFCRICCGKVSKNPIRNFVQLPCAGWRDIVENWFGVCCCSFGSKAETLSAKFERSLQLQCGKCLVGLSSLYVDVSDVSVHTEPPKEMESSGITQQPSSLSFLAVGNGFMVWENEHSNSVDWLAVHCIGCASLIGAYPLKRMSSGYIREGLHLFRSRITIKNADGSLHNGHRSFTFKKSLIKELHLRTDENMSYRFLIRSLRSKKPLLQLVVLSYDSFLCTGTVSDTHVVAADGIDVRGLVPAGHLDEDCALQQSVKLMFLDCTNLSAEKARSAEQWVEDHDTETVYMLEELVDELKNELLANSSFCPAAGGWSQNFCESFLSVS